MSIVLNEVYFGEQPELLEAVVHLGNFRKKYTNIKGRVKSKWNADPEYVFRFTLNRCCVLQII